MTARTAAPAALAAVLVALVVAWSPWDGGGGTTVHAVFDSVPGLVEGAEVRAGGLKVGSVQGISLADERPRVTLRIDDGYRLRRGATADLRLGSLSGSVNRIVAVDAGDGPLLQDGATLGTARTDQPVEVDDVLSTLDPRTRGEMRSVLRGVREATDGRGPDLAAALSRSTRALRGTADVLEQALRDLVRSGSRVSVALAAAPGATGGAIDELGGLLRDTAAEQTALTAALADLPAGLRAPRRALDRVAATTPTLRALVRDARPGVRELRAASPELRTLLRAAGPTLDDAAALVRSAPQDLHALGTLLPTARKVLPRLDEVLRVGNPIADEVRVRLPDFFSFFANWADFTSNYDVNGHAARVGLVLPPAPLTQVDGTTNAAGHLKAPFIREPGVLQDEPWTDYRDSFVGGDGR
jgi:phospholipid/cholesterol/gamma-HCH transport system substrate-binding protein